MLSFADTRTCRTLQAFGVDPLFAGNVVQLTIVLGISLGYISTYVFRVANKVRRAPRPAAVLAAPHNGLPRSKTSNPAPSGCHSERSGRRITRDTATERTRAGCVPRQQTCLPALLQAVTLRAGT